MGPRARFVQVIFQKGEDNSSSSYSSVKNQCVALSEAAANLLERAAPTWPGRELKSICNLRCIRSAIDPQEEAINHH